MVGEHKCQSCNHRPICQIHKSWQICTHLLVTTLKSWVFSAAAWVCDLSRCFYKAWLKVGLHKSIITSKRLIAVKLAWFNSQQWATFIMTRCVCVCVRCEAPKTWNVNSKVCMGFKLWQTIFFASWENILTSLQDNDLIIQSIMKTFKRVFSNCRKR